jgi:hypothetical protein
MMIYGTPSSEQSKTIDPADVSLSVSDIQALFKIMTTLDFSTVKSGKSISEILEHLLPNVPKIKRAELEKQATALIEANVQKVKKLEENQQPEETSYFVYKVFFTIAVTIAGACFGQSLATKGSKILITQIYTVLFGTPDPKSVTYGLLLAPSQKFLSTLSRLYGSYAVGFITAPVAYCAANMTEKLCAKANYVRTVLFPKKLETLSLASAESIIAEFDSLSFNGPEKPEYTVSFMEDCVALCPNYDYLREVGSEKDKNRPSTIEYQGTHLKSNGPQ